MNKIISYMYKTIKKLLSVTLLSDLHKPNVLELQSRDLEQLSNRRCGSDAHDGRVDPGHRIPYQAGKGRQPLGLNCLLRRQHHRPRAVANALCNQ